VNKKAIEDLSSTGFRPILPTSVSSDNSLGLEQLGSHSMILADKLSPEGCLFLIVSG
jgi:hypothetical protein